MAKTELDKLEDKLEQLSNRRERRINNQILPIEIEMDVVRSKIRALKKKP